MKNRDLVKLISYCISHRLRRRIDSSIKRQDEMVLRLGDSKWTKSGLIGKVQRGNSACIFQVPLDASPAHHLQAAAPLKFAESSLKTHPWAKSSHGFPKYFLPLHSKPLPPNLSHPDTRFSRARKLS